MRGSRRKGRNLQKDPAKLRERGLLIARRGFEVGLLAAYDPSPSATMQDPRPELNSWKEIADRLDVSVRTAQLWEKERGLPVRRVPGGRGRVFIRVAELEEWRDSGERPTSLDGPPTEGKARRMPRPVMVAGVVLVAVVTVALAVAHPWDRARIARVEFAREGGAGNDMFVGLYEHHGTLIRTLHFDNVVESAVVSPDEPGSQSVFIGFGKGSAEHRGHVAAFDVAGDELWTFDLYDMAILAEARGARNDVSDMLTPTDLHLADVDGRAVVAVVAHDLNFFASRVTLLAADSGEHLGTYWHDGGLGYGLSVLGDLNADGAAELVVPGHGNGLWGELLPQNSPHAVVMAFDLAELATWGHSQSWPRRRWHSMPLRMPLWYHIIPPDSDGANVSELSLRDANRDGNSDIYVRTVQGMFYLFKPDGGSATAAPSSRWQEKYGADAMPPDTRRVTDLDIAISECLAGDIGSGMVHLGRAETQVSVELIAEWSTRCRALAEKPAADSGSRP